MKVKFNRDVTYETEGPGKGPSFKKDQVHDFRDDIAQRWVRRGVAQIVDDGQKHEEAKPSLSLAAVARDEEKPAAHAQSEEVKPPAQQPQSPQRR